MTHVRPLTPLVFALVASRAFAQAPPFVDDDAISLSSSLPGITRLDSGRIDFNEQRDVILLAGSTLHFIPAASTHNDVVPMASVVATDASVAQKASASGFDAIAVVNASGLHRYDWVGTAGAPFQGVDIDTTSAWAGALVVRCGDLDNTGNGDDYVGIGSNLRTIVVRLATSGASTSFTIPFDAIDVIPVRWDGDVPLELAVLTAREVRIHEQNGALKERFVGDATVGDSFALVHTSGATRDRLAWIDKAAGGAQTLRVLKPGQMEVAGNLSTCAPGEDFFAIESGDIDIDSNDDLVIARRSSYDPLYLHNDWPAAAMFSVPASPAYIPVGSGATGSIFNTAAPHSADFDADNDADLLVAAGSVNRLMLLQGTGQPVDPTYQEISETTGGGSDGQTIIGAPGSRTHLTATQNVAFELRFIADNNPTNATQYLLKVYREKVHPVTGVVYIEDDLVGAWQYGFGSESPLNASEWFADFTLASETDTCFTQTYWFELERMSAIPYQAASESRVFSMSNCGSVVRLWLCDTGVAYWMSGQQCGSAACPPSSNCTLPSQYTGVSPGPAVVARRRLPPPWTPGSNPSPQAIYGPFDLRKP